MVSVPHKEAIESFEKHRKNVREQPLYVLRAFASRHKIPGRSTRDRAQLEKLVILYIRTIRSFPNARVACYSSDPRQVDCRRYKSIPTREGALLRYKILKEEGENACPHKKYWICNLQEMMY